MAAAVARSSKDGPQERCTTGGDPELGRILMAVRERLRGDAD
jgi:predicted NAD-dependent protein-ADP-ribosyltransferase YbiA (DUF1768 family)